MEEWGTQCRVNMVHWAKLCIKAAGCVGEEARSSFLAEVVSQLAQLLKDSGFGAALRDRRATFGNAGDAVAARQRERQEQLKAAGRRLVLAALLASACFTGHLAHVWPGALFSYHAPYLACKALTAIVRLFSSDCCCLDGPWSLLFGHRKLHAWQMLD